MIKALNAIVALVLLSGCSKPQDPSGLYLIQTERSKSHYDIRSAGVAKVSGRLNAAGPPQLTSWSTEGTWEMVGDTLVISAPRPQNQDSDGRVTQHKFTIEPNGDLISVDCEELAAGIRAVKQ
jgi:hypothetical protein